MEIHTSKYEPYQYVTRYETLRYVEARAQNLKHSIRLVQKDSERLVLRCPLSGDYIDILGEPGDIEWLNEKLKERNWYRTT